ncbi:hypothetical protein WR25_12072 [Diploscapter pachys]|uniref:Tyrosine-protein kinase n=1 Tax=Diploscapter pachys TaxID=2018661 RepID=A0A2A2LRD0_9BILA|nr:hypothetical protein WR25_12072 [Diploscapter pachys]
MDDKLKAAVDSVAQQYYFHGFLSREDAPFLLYRSGDYILRVAQTLEKAPNGTLLKNYYLLLSVFAAPKGTPSTLPLENRKQFVRHLVINTDNGYSLCKDKTFQSMEQLIQHYFRNAINLNDNVIHQIEENDNVVNDAKSQQLTVTDKIREQQQPSVKKVGHVTLVRGISLANWEIHHKQLDVGDQIRIEVGTSVHKGVWNKKDGKKVDVLLRSMEDDCTNSERVKDLLQERRFMKKHDINCPVILKIKGICVTRQPSFQVCEAFMGVPLNEYMRDHHAEMTNEERCAIIFCISHALYFLHKKDIIHRDIAAANVLYQKGGLSKLTSLGLSRSVKGTGVYNMKKSRAMAVRWMAPENINTLVFSKASDVYSFGVFVFEVFTGHEPYLNRSMPEAKKAIINGEIPKFPIDVPRKLARMIEKHCWTKAPKERADMEDIAANLQEYSGLELNIFAKKEDSSDPKEQKVQLVSKTGKN